MLLAYIRGDSGIGSHGTDSLGRNARAYADTAREPSGWRSESLTMMLLYMLPLLSSMLMRMMQVSSFCWL